LLGACLPAYRALIATALLTGKRLWELLGLIWDDIDLIGGSVRVRAQLSRAHRRSCPASRAEDAIGRSRHPLARNSPRSCARTARLRHATPAATGCSRNGTPLGQRNVQRGALTRAARLAGLDDEGAGLRFHDLRHTFASHLIIDLHLGVVQVSRMLGHASVSTTLDVYDHLFDEARHAADIRARMAASTFPGLLSPEDDRTVIGLRAVAEPGAARLSARERAAIRWAT
jgi:integrase